MNAARRQPRITVQNTLLPLMVAAAAPLLVYLTRSGQAFPDAVDKWRRHRLRGPVLARYRAEGGPIGHLGLPLSGEVSAHRSRRHRIGADREVRFERGFISLDTQSGTTDVVFYNQTVSTIGQTPIPPDVDPVPRS